jgi:Icc-related predicted phosphoesterase
MHHDLPEGDILIHAGDISNRGSQRDVNDFMDWFMNLKYDTKIFISGNHDFCFERVNEPHHVGDYDWLHHLMSTENLSQSDVTYLEDNFITIESPEFSRPIKIYGTPWQPEFYNWAFNLPRMGQELYEKWNNIPTDTDILITHGPPNGFGDLVNNWRQPNVNVGCELLRTRIEEVKPILNIFGHIHEGYGIYNNGKTTFVNASICTVNYIPQNKPIVIELKENNGEITATHVEK